MIMDAAMRHRIRVWAAGNAYTLIFMSILAVLEMGVIVVVGIFV